MFKDKTTHSKELFIDNTEVGVSKEATSKCSEAFAKKLFPKPFAKSIAKKLAKSEMATKDNFTNTLYFDIGKCNEQKNSDGELEQAILLSAYGRLETNGFILNRVIFIYPSKNLPKQVKKQLEKVIKKYEDELPEAAVIATDILKGKYLRKLPYDQTETEEENPGIAFELKEIALGFVNTLPFFGGKEPISNKRFIYGIVWLIIIAGLVSVFASEWLVVCIGLEGMFLLLPLMNRRVKDLGLSSIAFWIIGALNIIAFIACALFVVGMEETQSGWEYTIEYIREYGSLGTTYPLIITAVLTVVLQIVVLLWNIKMFVFSKSRTYSGDIEHGKKAKISHPVGLLKASGGSFNLPCAVANVDNKLYYKVGEDGVAAKAIRKSVKTRMLYPIVSVLATLSFVGVVFSIIPTLYLIGEESEGATIISSSGIVVDASDIDFLTDGDLVVVNGGYIDLTGATAEEAATSVVLTLTDETIEATYIANFATDDYSVGEDLYVFPIFAANVGDEGEIPFFSIPIYNASDEEKTTTIGAYMYGDIIIDSGDQEYTLEAGEINCISLYAEGLDNPLEGDVVFQIVIDDYNVYSVLIDYEAYYADE